MAEKPPTTQRISDDAVSEATGKNWKQWFSQMDRDGCKKMPHKEIALLLAKKYTLSPWWSQMVTVAYEQAPGLRAVHEKPKGFEISVSKTLAVTREQAFQLWIDERQRRKWLKEKIIIRKATPEKSLRIGWGDSATKLSVEFYTKTENKTQIVVRHEKLADATNAEAMKVFWIRALEKLEEMIKY